MARNESISIWRFLHLRNVGKQQYHRPCDGVCIYFRLLTLNNARNLLNFCILIGIADTCPKRQPVNEFEFFT